MDCEECRMRHGRRTEPQGLCCTHPQSLNPDPLRRLFWSADERFLKQFRGADLRTRFKAYSKFPPCFKDVSFWTNEDFTENNLCEVVRGIAGEPSGPGDVP